MKTTLLACAAFAAVLSAGDPAAAAQGRCLRVGEIWNWDALNDKTIIVEDNLHYKFKLNLIGTCYSLKFKERLAFRSIGGLSISCLEPGDQVIARDFGMANRCSIIKIAPYTAEMEKADKEAAKEQRGGY